MSQKVKDGITIDNTVYLADDKHTALPYYIKLVQFLAIMVGAYNTISIVVYCLSLSVSNYHLLISVAFISTGLFFLFLNPFHDIIKMIGIAVIYLLVLYKRMGQILNAFFIIENSVIDKVSDYYGFAGKRFLADYTTQTQDITLFVIMLLIPLIGLLTAAILRNRFISINYILLLIPIAFSLAVGIIPSEKQLIIYILIMLFLSKAYGSGKITVTKNQKSLIHRVNLSSAFIICMLSLGLFFLIKLFVSPKDYERIYEIKDIKSEIQTFLYDFSIEDFTNKYGVSNWNITPDRNIATGGLDGGKLGRVDQIQYNNSQHLKLTMPFSSISEGVYLKGYVGSVYTGDSWNGHNKEQRANYQKLLKEIPLGKFEAVNQSNLLFKQISKLDLLDRDSLPSNPSAWYHEKYQIMQGQIKIDYLEASKNYIYAPYLADFSILDDVRYEWDLYAKPEHRNDNYVLDYYFGLSLQDEMLPNIEALDQPLGDYPIYEKLYRDYVYDVYTKLPEHNLNRLKENFSGKNEELGTTTIQNAIQYIKNYLHSNTDYTLSPGRLPKDKDFVEYFLYDNKVGYCSHYASAAVLMLRAMGYPARYAEGYAVSSSDIIKQTEYTQSVIIYADGRASYNDSTLVEVSVNDYNAHAWVEVYLDGLGWFPIEFTPGAGLENTEEVVGELSIIGEEIKEEEESVTVAPTETPTETNQMPEEEKEHSTKQNKEGEEPDTETDEELIGKETKEKATIKPLFMLAIIILVGTGPIIYFIIRIKNRRIMMSINNSNKALLIYEKLEKLFKSCRALPKRARYLEDHIIHVTENCSYVDRASFKHCMDIVWKARFGKDVISVGELLVVEHFHREVKDNVYRKASFIKRFYLKVVLRV